MRKRKVTEYIMSNSDLKELVELSNLAIAPYIDEIEKRFPESKHRQTFNMLSQKDRVYTEGMKRRVKVLCDLAFDIIRERISFMPDELNSVPEEANGIIARPRAYLQALLETYTSQIKHIDYMRAIFSVESPVDVEEEELAG